MKQIAVLDNTFYIRNRIRELTQHLNTNILEADTAKQLLTVLNTHTDIDLIILEINLPHDDGFRILRDIRQKRNQVPILILTSENKRSAFIRGIQEGASDYILKPFDDNFLVSRIEEHLNRERSVTKQAAPKEPANATLSVDFQNYLDKELRKASKGGYEVTLMVSMFFKPVAEVTSAVEREYHKMSELIYPALAKNIFETDLFMTYGSQSFIGVFPFCSTENQHFIEEKFERVFEDLQLEQPLLSSYRLINIFVTYPRDGDSRDAIMKELVQRLYEGIEKEKIMLMHGEFNMNQLM